MIDIQNWGHADQRAKLTELIRTQGIRTIIEIGSYIGASAAFFASHAEVERIMCIDPFVAEGEWAKEVEAAGVPIDFYDVFIETVRWYGIGDRVATIRRKSADAAALHIFADMVYIDGDHSYEGCASDIRLYLPKARKVIAGDDHHFDDHGNPHFPGVVKACEELLPGYEHNSRMWWKVIA